MAGCFFHDCNARNDPKILELRMKHGMAGYGIYFSILEKLTEDKNHKCLKNYDTIAFELRVDFFIVKSVVEDFGLFVFTDDGKYFYSESITERMESVDKISKARAEAGRAGGLAKARNRREKGNAVSPVQENMPSENLANANKSSIKPVANANKSVANAKEEKETEKENVSPAPLIKEKDKEKEMSYQTDSGRLTAKNLHQRCREYFESFIKDKYQESYYWTGKDAGQLKQLLNAIKFTRKNHIAADGSPLPKPTEDSDMLAAFKAFVDYAYSHGGIWLKGKFTIAILNSQYNSLQQSRSLNIKATDNGNDTKTGWKAPDHKDTSAYRSGFGAAVGK